MTDFNQLVLPAENPILRAVVTQQRTGHPSNDIPRAILTQLAELVLLEHDLLGNFEHMKREIENIRGYSTVALFNELDTFNKKYLDAGRLWDFMYDMAFD